ncbi:MAG: ABC transporter permease [Chloroflexota bacterium]
MTELIVRRLIHSVFVLFGVSVIVFGLVRLSGDPTALLLPIDATEEDEQQLREALGLGGPIYVQYWNFISQAAQGDFGQSIRHRQPAMESVTEKLPATFQLAGASFAIALAIAVPLGILSALYPNSIIDRVSVVMALVGQAIPTFLLGILLILLMAVQLRLLPSSGSGGPEHLILPALTLGTYSAAIINRLLRSSLLEAMNEDYIRTARAKGFDERYIVFRHALKNAAIPVITVVGLQIGNLISGSVVTETVFSYPGAGLLLVQSLNNADFPVVQAFVMVIAVFVILINLIVDIIYGFVDPRVRVTG